MHGEYRGVAFGVAAWLRGLQIASAVVDLAGAIRRDVPGYGFAWGSPEGAFVEASGVTAGPFSPGSFLSFPALPPAPPTRSKSEPRVGGQRRLSWQVLAQFAVAELADGRLDASSRHALGHAARRVIKRRDGRRPVIGPSGGVVWRVAASGQQLTCWDAGGILDTNPNTEASPWAPQAMGNYYADAYAAAVFAHCSVATGSPDWHEAAVAAIGHVARTYVAYPSGPIWYHHDFKNAPYLEALDELGLADSDTTLGTASLHTNSYEPTNVMAVRLHWLGVRAARQPRRGDRRRIGRARALILGRQLESGLLLDDRPPLHRDAHDLSYHQFAMAFLGRYLASTKDPEVERAFLRGVEYSAGVQTPDGDVALTGRGTNNVYHQAAAVYAFEVAATRTGRDDYAKAAERAFRRLARFARPDGSLPTALNAYPERRMGWNHCATPYNALSAYLLLHAATEREARTGAVVTTAALARRRGSLLPSIARQDAGASFLIVGAAYQGGYRWSDLHLAGVGGIAAWGTALQGTMTLALDDLEGFGEVTDLPEVRLDGELFSWRTPGELFEDHDGLRYRVSNRIGSIDVRWRLGAASLLVNAAFSARNGGTVQATGRFALVEAAVSRWTAVPGRLETAHSDGAAIRIDIDNCDREPEMRRVPSNPRGEGWLASWPHSPRVVAAGGSYEMTHRVSIAGGGPAA